MFKIIKQSGKLKVKIIFYKEYYRRKMYEFRNRKYLEEYYKRVIKLPGRCIDEKKVFTIDDLKYIKSIPDYQSKNGLFN